jgi:hypothetical protein
VIFVSAMDYKFEFINLDNGADFLKWKEMTLLMIEVFDFQYPLYGEAPKVPIEDSVEANEMYDLKVNEWERSDNVSLLFIKNTIFSNIRNAIPDSLYANEYVASIEEHFKDV